MNHQRHVDIFDPGEHKNDAVTMIGLGGVGSFSTICLAKLGIPKLTLVDFDDVEEHNIPVQMYDPEFIGERKTYAMAGMVSGATGMEPATLDGKFTKQGWEPSDGETKWPVPRGVVVSGLDSMRSRQYVWDSSGVKLNPYVSLYLDVRLGGQDIVIYAINPSNMEDIKQYEDTIHPDSEAVSNSCTARGIIDVGFTVGSLVTRLVRNHLDGNDVPNITMFGQRNLSIQQGDWVA